MSTFRKSSEQLKAESPWDRLLDDAMGRKRRAYKEACDLDSTLQHDAADTALRAAGIAEHIILDRRRHIAWRISQHLPPIGEW
jgi:hypothetical protein